MPTEKSLQHSLAWRVPPACALKSMRTAPCAAWIATPSHSRCSSVTRSKAVPRTCTCAGTADKGEWTPLLGPLSRTRFHTDPTSGRLIGAGSWLGINYALTLVLAKSKPAWFWHVRLENTGATSQQVDLTYAQDIALANYGGIRLNEFYVSQYLDHTALKHGKRGVIVATRQNLAADGRIPWSLIGSLREGSSYATDAKQFHGLATRAGEPPIGLVGDLPSRRLQHEHAMVVIRDVPIRLDPKCSATAGFFGLYVPDHPEATAPTDVERADEALGLPEATPLNLESQPADGPDNSTLFSAAPLLETLDLDADSLREFFGSQWRHDEVDASGERLSFFHGADSHVVLRSKELRVLRPHGHILRTGRHTTPDETAIDLDRLDEWRFSLDGHRGTRQHQPFSVDNPHLPRFVPLPRTAGLRAGRCELAVTQHTVRVRDVAGRLPLDLSSRGWSDPGSRRREQRAARADTVDRSLVGCARAVPHFTSRRSERRRWQRAGRGGLAPRRRKDRARPRAEHGACRAASPRETSPLLPCRARSFSR